MKFAHIREANISHLRSKYFTAKLFHLPAGQISLKKAHIVLVDKRVLFSGRGRRTWLGAASQSRRPMRLCSAPRSGAALTPHRGVIHYRALSSPCFYPCQHKSRPLLRTAFMLCYHYKKRPNRTVLQKQSGFFCFKVHLSLGIDGS